jgi:hypothetical protein
LGELEPRFNSVLTLSKSLAVGTLLLSISSSNAWGQRSAAITRDAVTSLTSFQIPRLAREPKIEDFAGMQPSPPVSGMLKIDQFWQHDPIDGQPISQKTEAYLGYTDKNLYVVFLAFDDHVAQLRNHLVRREQINDEDQVGIFLDTFYDHRHCVFFFINPAGVQQEGTYFEGQQDIDLSWDTIWKSETRVVKEGWIGYISVPFKSLRFKSTKSVQEWGVLLERDIPHNNKEHSFSPRNSQNVQGLLTQEGSLSAFKDISPGRNFLFIPYVSGRSFRSVDARDPVHPTFEAKDIDVKAGLDAKAVIKDSFVLDATINPDFGQVESDEPQITVNQRFEVLFPEKRPFFQENSGYFATPINLVFTRRIADPLYGIRLTGKRGPWSVGTLFADDQSPGESVAPNDPLWGRQAYFGIARVSREIDNKGSNIGLLYTDRELNTDPNTVCTSDACVTRTNRVGGLDAHLKFNKNWQLDAQAVGSETRLNDGTYYAGAGYYLYLERSTRNVELNSMYKDNAPGFKTRTGFFQRPDIRWFSNFAQRKFYVEGKHLLFHGPSLYTRNIWDHNGLRVEYFANTNYRWVFNNRNNFGVYANYGRERLRPLDYSQLTANIDIPHDQVGFFFNSDYFNWMTLALEANIGRDTNYDPVECGSTLGDCPVVALPPGPGKARFTQFSATFRPGRGLTVENTFFYYALRDLQTNRNIINNYIARSKWNYQFTRDFSLRVIGQYNGNVTNPAFTSVQNARNFNADVLFTYLIHPGTAIYVGYNSDLANIDRNLATDPTDYTRLVRAKPYINDGRQFFVKLSYLLRF